MYAGLRWLQNEATTINCTIKETLYVPLETFNRSLSVREEKILRYQNRERDVKFLAASSPGFQCLLPTLQSSVLSHDTELDRAIAGT